jgi:hypothetical protein
MRRQHDMFIYPEDVDQRLSWRPGTAERLARQRRLPYALLPDGAIRFDWDEIEPLIVRVRAVAAGTPERAEVGHAP